MVKPVSELPPTEPRPVDDAYAVLKQWTFVALEQCARLHEALVGYFDASETYRQWRRANPLRPGTGRPVPPEYHRNEEAFFRVQGASFFVVSAVSHVVAAIDADEHLGKLPRGLHAKVKQLRNVLEHWDEWHLEKLSAKSFRATHPDIWPFGVNFTSDDFLVGGVIPFADLEAEMLALWRWLRSPSPARVWPPVTEPIYPYPLEDR